MSEDSNAELLRQFTAKTREIVAAVAKAEGIEDATHLDPRTAQHLDDKVKRLIEFFAEWQAINRQITGTDLARLLKERHEIEEQIRDLREEEIRDLRDSDD